MKHKTHRSPAEILMHGRHHHEGGGEASKPGGSMPENKPQYRGGGHPKRYHHAQGDEATTMGVNPISGYTYPGNPENKRKGGRACHAEGDTVEAVPYKRGGHSHRRKHRADGGDMEESMDKKKRGGSMTHREHHHKHREHHSFGSTVGSIASTVLPFLSMLLKKGGSAHKRRRHHEEGEEVPLKRAMGGVGKVRKGMMNENGSLT